MQSIIKYLSHGKNYSQATHTKQEELEIILTNWVSYQKKHNYKKVIYTDLNAGSCWWPNGAEGSPIISTRVFDKAKISYKSFFCEKSKKSRRMLLNYLSFLNQKCNFGGSVQFLCKNNQNASDYLKQLLDKDISNPHIVYYDPPGILSYSIVKQLTELFARTDILIRVSSRAEKRVRAWLSSYQLPFNFLKKLKQHWFISKPELPGGWCFLFGTNSDIKLGDFMYDIKSDKGRICFGYVSQYKADKKLLDYV